MHISACPWNVKIQDKIKICSPKVIVVGLAWKHDIFFIRWALNLKVCVGLINWKETLTFLWVMKFDAIFKLQEISDEQCRHLALKVSVVSLGSSKKSKTGFEAFFGLQKLSLAQLRLYFTVILSKLEHLTKF